jgi:nucleoside-diphosphate-sugar epimerase
LKIAITGGAGFTGRHFAHSAQNAGHQVVAVRSDLTDAQALATELGQIEVDAVVHLAAISFVGHQDERAFYDVNLFGTLNLLDALAGNGRALRRVLLASSANIYGNGSNGPISEELPPAPVNHYAMSKLAMEHMARRYLDRLPLITVRPFNYTGPGQALQFVIPKLVDHFQRRAPTVRLGNVNVQREYNDVRFVCETYLQLLEHGRNGETYNVCTGNTHDLQTVISLLGQLTGHQIGVEVDPALVRANEVQKLCGSPARIQSLLPALPSFSLEDTLRWMLATRA